MTKSSKILIIVALVCAIAAVVLLKQRENTPIDTAEDYVEANLPRMVEIGRDKCVPCKMMAPIITELKEEYTGRLVVESINLNEHPEAVEKYDVLLIPLQIFFDASGKELFRHEDFFSKEDILAKWKELGYSFDEVQSK